MQRMMMFSQPWARHLALWGALSLVASVQRGVIALGGSVSATATIADVDTRRSVLAYGGTYNVGGTGEPSYSLSKIILTNGTTVTATIANAYASTKDMPWTVIQFVPGVIKSIQTGTIVVTNPATSNTATINSVNTNKAWVNHQGFSTTLTPGVMADSYVNSSSELTNATTVTAKSQSTGGGTAATVTYTAVEMF